MNNPVALVEQPGLAGAFRCGTDVGQLTDDALLGEAAEAEREGRRIDARRVALAAEIAERSRKELGSAGLASRRGCGNANELLQRVTLVSAATAEKRMRLGRETRAQQSLVGLSMPARFPKVSEGLADGSLGVDAAAAIVRVLAPALGRSGIDELATAETELVASATGASDESPVAATADEVRAQAAVWHAFLDPDGAEPAEQKALRRRGLWVGRERDGITSFGGGLMGQAAAQLRRLLDTGLAPKTAPAFMSEEERRGIEAENDPRTLDQQRHDVFASMLDFVARSGEVPTIGGQAPTLLVSVRAEDLRSGHGTGHLDGEPVPISMRAVKQFACTGGVQQVVFDNAGRIIELGSAQRCFTPQQGRAITLRDGGCLIPGCQIPAGWCEIHHVTPAASEGETHTDNGVLLCWFHHRTIETSRWQIRMIRGVPHIKAPPWIDPRSTWRRATKAPTALADTIHRRAG
jgi:hypothetical protein